MEILIIFAKTDRNYGAGALPKLASDIVSIARSSSPTFPPEATNIHLIHGSFTNIPSSTQVCILISSPTLLNNSGSFIVNFKHKSLEAFKKHGINLDNKSLFIRIVEDKIIEEALLRAKDDAKIGDQEMSQTSDDFDYERIANQFKPRAPKYSFDRVILPEKTVEKIHEAIGIIECENKVFGDWGLYEIQPHPSSALSFYGPSGTGKTMAAEAIANKLNKKILEVSYADVESKFHGEGPKKVKAIFLAASRENAVLFFDEADSLLSRRLTNVTQGSEQAINSMRSQLLICLEQFKGIVIFATNLVANYDKAFLTRLISVEFTTPDAPTRKRIWDIHLRPVDDGKPHQLRIPLDQDVDTLELSQKYEFVGREIRNAVVSACVSAALGKRDIVCQQDLLTACNRIVDEKNNLKSCMQGSTTPNDQLLKAVIEKKIKSQTIDSSGTSS